ncbi:Galectin [Meloidogyne graminicola]|uniref:Galectin n=1 Tax=Meloidogyne graminicola TaxID=189291 RepID=A0A8S9ZL84_9BILA|nr:Galectin [Meloidogyne graminicola]
MHTIEGPQIPFNYPIPGGLQTGSEIIFHGATYNGELKRFHINLLGQGDDVVLHFNPRFKFLEDTIVLNSRTYVGWGTEERHRNRLSLGDSFRIRLVCHHSHFLVQVNDKEVANYEHRLSPQMIRGIEVDGDVSLQRIQMINFPQPPIPQPQYPSPYPSPQYPPPPAPYDPLMSTTSNPTPTNMPPIPPNPGWNPQQTSPYPQQQQLSPYPNNVGTGYPYRPPCSHCNSSGCHHCGY